VRRLRLYCPQAISSHKLRHDVCFHYLYGYGPTRPSPGWQAQVEGGYTVEHFEVDWAHQRVRCPQDKWSVAWWDQGAETASRAIFVECALEDCQACPARAVCTRAQRRGRRVGLPPRAQYEAVQAARAWLDKRPRAKTRTSRFAALAPVCSMS